MNERYKTPLLMIFILFVYCSWMIVRLPTTKMLCEQVPVIVFSYARSVGSTL